MLNYFDAIKAQSGIPVDDTWAQLWGNTMSTEYVITTYTGTLPATLKTVAGYLESYKIYGSTEQTSGTTTYPIMPSGCGERTGNLLDYTTVESTQFATAALISGGINISGRYFVRFRAVEFAVGRSYTMSWTAKTISGTVAPAWRFQYSDDTYSSVLGNGESFVVEKEVTWLLLYINTTSTSGVVELTNIMLNLGSTPLPYEPYGYKLPILSNSTVTDIYIGNAPLAKDEYVDSNTGKIYRRTKNLSPPEEEWMDEWIWGDGTIHPSTEIKTSPFIDVSTCETCIMEVFSTETEWAAAGYRAMAFYDENKQYLGWIGGGGGQTLTPNSTERLPEFPTGTVYVRIGCSHSDQPFYPQLVSGYTPTHRFYPYLVPTDPPVPFPQIPTVAGTTVIDYNGEPKPDKVELTYKGLRR